MNDLERLHIEYNKEKEEYAQCTLDIQKKSKEINEAKLEISAIKSKILEIDKSLNNARKGIGDNLSTDQLIALKNTKHTESNRLIELTDLLPLQEQSLVSLNNGSMSLGSSVRIITNKMTDIIANEAAHDAAITTNEKLKNLVYTVLSQHGFNFKGKTEDYDILYQQIGEIICKKLFATGNEPVNLPTIEQAIYERDLLIKNLA